MTDAADAVDVICELLAAIPEAAAIQFVTFARPSKMQDRVQNKARYNHLIEHAVALRAESSIPFWDALLLACEMSPDGLTAEMSVQASFHQEPFAHPDDRRAVDRNLEPWLRERINAGIDGEILALSSKVELRDGGHGHIPMLDFAARHQNAGSLSSIQTVANTIGSPGWLLASGRSYHFYGHSLLSDSDYHRFMGKALLFAPLVDHRWVAHQMIVGESALRISPGRDGLLPYVVAQRRPNEGAFVTTKTA